MRFNVEIIKDFRERVLYKVKAKSKKEAIEKVEKAGFDDGSLTEKVGKTRGDVTLDDFETNVSIGGEELIEEVQ